MGKARRREFSAVKVRLWLEEKAAPLVVDEKLYAVLSAYAIHASPDVLPQAHNQGGNSSIAPCYQEAGFLLCLNELARAMSFIGVFSASLIGVSDEIRREANKVSRLLAEKIGGITADVQGRPSFSLSK